MASNIPVLSTRIKLNSSTVEGFAARVRESVREVSNPENKSSFAEFLRSFLSIAKEGFKGSTQRQ